MEQKMIETTQNPRRLTVIQLSLLVILRVAIGWHFLYEGINKLFTPGWTSSGFLSVSKWIFSGFFQWLASNQFLLLVVDLLNIWGLILIGLALMFGCYTRIASISGMVLLSFYYLANPPFVGMDFGIITEGSYLIVDKNLVELIALGVLTFIPTGTFLGLDRYFLNVRKRRLPSDSVEEELIEEGEGKDAASKRFLGRRELLKSLATTPFIGAFVIVVLHKLGWESYEEKNISLSRYPNGVFSQPPKTDAVSSATIKAFNFSSLSNLQEQIPRSKIRNLELSRVILGGNLIGGWAHARDLIYVSKLVKAYHHKNKIFETFLLAEKCGINAFLTNPILCSVINEYWKRKIGNIQFISDCGGKNLMDGVNLSIDSGAAACYIHGGIADHLVREGKVEEIGKALDLIKQNGLPGGIGGHALQTVKECVRIGLEPDFWMKTLHHNDYWSAHPEKEHDNIWCSNPEETIEFMKHLKQPWIAFKTLAAGAIHPDVGFRYAFTQGADFICAGMYDFQIVDDVNIAFSALSGSHQRERPWMA